MRSQQGKRVAKRNIRRSGIIQKLCQLVRFEQVTIGDVTKRAPMPSGFDARSVFAEEAGLALFRGAFPKLPATLPSGPSILLLGTMLA
ncbi:MAG: hypothetical protein ABS57_19990 [Mesorhizobium sp. SCN 65-12]|nr:MAG: hypothetical protein ABS57_19990 [Mesorhizobium sp. SCN 65-12]